MEEVETVMTVSGKEDQGRKSKGQEDKEGNIQDRYPWMPCMSAIEVGTDESEKVSPSQSPSEVAQ